MSVIQKHSSSLVLGGFIDRARANFGHMKSKGEAASADMKVAQ